LQLQEQYYTYSNSLLRFSDLEWVADLGQGGFGTVTVMRDVRKDAPVALKVMRRSRLVKPKHINNVLSEKHAMETLRHPFIVRLFSTFKDDVRLMMAMEFIRGGEVYSWMYERDAGSKLTEDEARFTCASITCAIEHIHSHSYIYRDLKPENLMIGTDGYLKLVDFGYAKRIPPEGKTFTPCGTVEYMAPELIALHGYAESADWWATGVLLYECLHAYTPFSDRNTAETDMDIINNIHTLVTESESDAPARSASDRVHFDAGTSVEAQSLICSLLRKQPSQRATSAHVRSASFFQHFDWEALLLKQLKPPYVPDLSSDPFDTSSFCADIEKVDSGPSILSESLPAGAKLNMDAFESF